MDFHECENELRQRYVLFTKRELAAYFAAFLVVAAIVGLGSITVAHSAAMSVIESSTAATATKEIEQLRDKAQGDAAQIKRRLADRPNIEFGDVTCSSLKIVNDNGETLAQLNAYTDGGGQLTVHHPTSNLGVRVLGEVYGGGVYVYDPAGNELARLYVHRQEDKQESPGSSVLLMRPNGDTTWTTFKPY